MFIIRYSALFDTSIAGTTLQRDSDIRFDITNRFPHADWIEADLLQDVQKKQNFEEQLFEQCKARFPKNNIFGIDIQSAKVISQNNDMHGNAHIRMEFMTNL